MKRPIQAALFSLLIVCALGPSLADACDIILSQGMVKLSPYTGGCLNGLAHGYGEVAVSRELNSRKFTMSMEGMFRQGVLTKGKERGANGQYWYTGTFNNWQRWTGSMRTGLSYRGIAQQWNYTNGQEERVPIGTPANLEQDSLSHTQANGNNKVRNDPVLGAARKFIANGQREQFARAEKAQEEQRTTQEKERTSLSLNSTKVPRFMPQNKNENSTGSEERLAGQPQEQEANNPSEERGGIFGIPILGAFLKGMADGLPAQSARISDALKDAPGAYVDRKIIEEKERRERRKQEAEERKKQEVIARQEQENAAYWAKRDQEIREIRARAEEEDKKRRAKYEEEHNRQEQERLEKLAKQDQAAREAHARADEDRKQKEARVRNTPASSPIASTKPEAQQPPQRSPQVATQQPTNGRNQGVVSPTLGASTPSTPVAVPQPSPQVATTPQSTSGTTSPNLSVNQFPSAQPTASQRQPSTTTVSERTSGTKQSPQKVEFVYDCNHFPGQGYLGRSYTDAERKFVANCATQTAREVAEINTSNKRLDTAIKITKGVQKGAEIAGTGVAIASGAAEGAALARGAYAVGKTIVEKRVVTTVESATARGAIDAAGTGGINKTVAKNVTISKSRFPESAQHAEDAIAAGKPNVLTIDRTNTAARRRDSLRGTKAKPGFDRDEFPPAMFEEGGRGASIRHINPNDNRGAGACIGAQCRGLPDGTKVRIDVMN